MKLIGLDIGEKRIGVSLADTSVRIAHPHSTIIADGTELDQIKALIRSEGTDFLVVGLPRNNSGEETAQTKIVRMFALQLKARGAKVKFQDESLTSVEAERRLKLRKKGYKKEDIDAEAATIILQDFIETFKAQPSSRGKSAESFSDNILPARTTTSIPDATDRFGSPSDGVGAPDDEPEAVLPDGQRMRSSAETGIGRKTVQRFSSKKLSRKFIAPTIIVSGVIALSITAIWFASGTTPAGNSPLREPFTITEGQSTSQIAQNLHAAGLIKNPTVFTIAARLSRANIPAKTHFISSSADIWQILDQISLN